MRSTSENQTNNPPGKQSTGNLLLRALRLRCPTCGEGKLFRTFLSMNDPCPHCRRKFEREPGFWLGSIYFNYGVTTLIVVVLYFSLYLTKTVSGNKLLAVLGTFALLFPLWFFRYARALWVSFDERYDPWPIDSVNNKTIKSNSD